MATTTPVQALPIPDGNDTPDVPRDFRLLAEAVEKKIIMVFGDAAARTTALPAPVAGMRTYLSDVGRTDIFDGAIWVPVGYLKTPRCHAYVSAAQKLNDTTASGTWEVVALDGEVYDAELPMHDPAVSNTRLTAKVAGLYAVNAQIFFDPDTTGYRMMQVKKNANKVSTAGTLLGTDRMVPMSSSGIGSVLSSNFDVQLSVNDYIELFGYQSSTATGGLPLGTGSGHTFLQARWVSA